jgi:hypothetical protein
VRGRRRRRAERRELLRPRHLHPGRDGHGRPAGATSPSCSRPTSTCRPGAKGESYSYTQGDGAKSVTYTKANLGDLTQAIRLLQAQLGIVRTPRRALRSELLMADVPVLLGPDARRFRPAWRRPSASGQRPARARLDAAAGLLAGGAAAGLRLPLRRGQLVTSPEMGEWLPTVRSPDQEINLYRDRMVARQRDLYRNDGWAKGAIGSILDSTIGAPTG